MKYSNSVRYLISLALISILAACGGGGGGGGQSAELPTRLVWTEPTQNTDGSLLNDLAKYRVYYGGSANTLDFVYEFQALGNSLSFNSLSTADQNMLVSLMSANSTHYFAMTSVTAGNIESAYSNIVKYP